MLQTMLWNCYVSWKIECFFFLWNQRGTSVRQWWHLTLQITHPYHHCRHLKATGCVTQCNISLWFTLVTTWTSTKYTQHNLEFWLTSMCRVKSSWKLVYVLHADKCPFLCDLNNVKFQRICGMTTGKYVQVDVNV